VAVATRQAGWSLEQADSSRRPHARRPATTAKRPGSLGRTSQLCSGRRSPTAEPLPRCTEVMRPCAIAGNALYAPFSTTRAARAGRSGTSAQVRTAHRLNDVALGHATKQTWNEPGKWIWSKQTVYEPLIDTGTFEQVQALHRAKGAAGERTPRRTPRAYALRGILRCGICGRIPHHRERGRELDRGPLARRVRPVRQRDGQQGHRGSASSAPPRPWPTRCAMPGACGCETFPSPSTSCYRWLVSWPLRLAVLFQLLECRLPDLLMLLMGSAQLVVGGVLKREH
jgi:hypothetical protein